MGKATKYICAGAIAIVGRILASQGSIVGFVVYYISLCALIVFVIQWLNSTNRK